MSRLWLPEPLAEQVRAEARAAHPAECCGLLVGQGAPLSPEGARVGEVVPARNLEAARREDRFEIDPALRLAVMRRLGLMEGDGAARARAAIQGPRVLGHYHSHPGGRAEPSEVDRRRADEAGLVWLIVGADGALGAWLADRAADGHAVFRPLELRLAPRE